jgi:hypothetical protein
MQETIANPFAVLSLIVAPAILTNASSVLAMSTSNRLARAVDRTRDLTRQLEGVDTIRGEPHLLRELTVAEDRAVLLLRTLRSFYTAMGAFACATLFSLIGAVVTATGNGAAVRTMEVTAVAAGALAVGALVHGSVMLFRETGMAVAILRDRVESVRARRGALTDSSPGDRP